MKKKILVLMSLILILAMMSLVACNDEPPVLELPQDATLEEALEGYELVFEDNFDTLDATRWSVGYGQPTRRGGYYTEDAVCVRDGRLVITTDYRENGVYGSGWYTGWVESASRGAGHIAKPDTYNGFSTTYGYFEARLKAPATKGIWSAFWLMPDSAKGAKGMSAEDIIGTGKDGVEIDVMESLHYGKGKQHNANQHVLHGDGYAENANTEASPLYDIGDMYGEFHTYGVMWTESEYTFYVDGRETWSTPHRVDQTVHGVSTVDEYMLLTVEIAGVTRDGQVYPGQDFDADGKRIANWAGDPNRNNRSNKYDFEIDYVRVYQK